MPYTMRGLFLEACDCRVVCPCWFSEDPDDDACTGLFVWHIEQGEINWVDVSGCSAASVSFHTGHRGTGGQQVIIFVDANASAEQGGVLFQAMSGALGGPLGELADLADTVTGPVVVPIVYRSDGASTSVTIGAQVAVDMAPLVGTTQRVTTLADSALARALAPLAEVGKSSRYHVEIAEPEFRVDIGGRSANRGRFAYRSTGA